ncbi:MAG: response regulator [Bacteroidetes bacterium]|nr:MAG: response regulator [Bacteroidota bacterium]
MKTGRPKTSNKPKILIAEDSPTQAEQLRHLLERNNYNVTLAVNGKQALAMLEKFIPDLIISDILMPEMDGYELCTRIKESEKLKEIPVILLTSLTDPEDVLKGLTCGADNFFTKPFIEDYFISHIHQLIAQPALNKIENIRIVVEIFFAGKKRLITANQMQMLTLLLSTYEAAVMQNRQLVKTQEELKSLNESLEEKVEKRTMELKESMEKYFDLYNNTPSMFLSVENGSGGIIECNDTLLTKTGFKRSEVIGEHTFSLFHPDCLEQAKKNMQIFIETGELRNSEMELLTKLGGKIPVLLNATSVKDENGKILHSRTVMQDISLLIQAQEQIRQSEERFRAVADSAVDSIITVDEVGIIVSWNQGAKKTFGYDEKDIIGHQLTILIPEVYIADHSIGFKRIQQEGEPVVIGKTVELQGKRKNGEIFPIELSLAQWATATDRFFTGIIRDITYRKLRQKELIEAKEKAEESDKLKSAFLANMSHEIRTPLNGILGFSELLKEQNLTDEEKEDFINTVDQCSRQLLHIVTDIIDISKIEAGQDIAHPVVFNLPDLLEKVRIFFQPLAHHRNLILTLNNELPPNVVNVQSDPDKLLQALNNIIDNAIKFTETGSVRINISTSDNRLIFKVIDSGIGIEPAFHKVIFDRFRQVELSMSRKYGGTGLGLSLAKSFIEMLGGTIEVDSSPGKGSTFTSSIPLIMVDGQLEEKKDVKKGSTSAVEMEGKIILLAEDEETNSFVIKSMLKSTGLKILFAINGLEAVEKCKKDPGISLVLMDIKMPEMDGLTATRLIKSFRSDLPVIATTAYALTNDKKRCFEAGCNDFLSKPIIKEELINVISKYLN